MLFDGYYHDELQDGTRVTIVHMPAHYDNSTGKSYPGFCIDFDKNYNVHFYAFFNEKGGMLFSHDYDDDYNQ